MPRTVPWTRPQRGRVERPWQAPAQRRAARGSAPARASGAARRRRATCTAPHLRCQRAARRHTGGVPLRACMCARERPVAPGGGLDRPGTAALTLAPPLRSHARARARSAPMRPMRPRPLSAEALVELQVQNAGLRKRLERSELEREVSELSAREKGEVRRSRSFSPRGSRSSSSRSRSSSPRGSAGAPLRVPGAVLTRRARDQENLELQRLQGDLENQVRSRQQEIAALQAKLARRDDEHRTKQTGGLAHA